MMIRGGDKNFYRELSDKEKTATLMTQTYSLASKGNRLSKETKFMDGVNILATNVVGSANELIGILLIAIGTLLSVLILYIAFSDDMPEISLFLCLSVIIVIFGIFVSKDTPVRQYVVTISENVGMTDFCEKYDIVSVNGELYTVQEKEQ